LALPVALLVSAGIALLGWAARALTIGGAALATLVGTAVLAGTGWPGCAALAAFFTGSSLVSRLLPDPTAQLDAKGARRDGWQVLANGGPAAAGALLEPGHPGLGLWIVTASLATAAADTWATSFGGLSRTWPREIPTGRTVPPGTSGGVTPVGSIGGAVGAVVVAAAGASTTGDFALFPAAIVIGIAGMVLDSLAGTWAQARFHCPRCDTLCERAVHHCGEPATHQKGWRWLNNDGVNAIATGFGALMGWLAWGWLRPLS
jgi:uncharacterized protein (TIGR00297 family)